MLRRTSAAAGRRTDKKSDNTDNTDNIITYFHKVCITEIKRVYKMAKKILRTGTDIYTELPKEYVLETIKTLKEKYKTLTEEPNFVDNIFKSTDPFIKAVALIYEADSSLRKNRKPTITPDQTKDIVANLPSARARNRWRHYLFVHDMINKYYKEISYFCLYYENIALLCASVVYIAEQYQRGADRYTDLLQKMTEGTIQGCTLSAEGAEAVRKYIQTQCNSPKAAYRYGGAELLFDEGTARFIVDFSRSKEPLTKELEKYAKRAERYLSIVKAFLSTLWRWMMAQEEEEETYFLFSWTFRKFVESIFNEDVRRRVTFPSENDFILPSIYDVKADRSFLDESKEIFKALLQFEKKR